ncbi:MAG: biopolymer transporter ExbD [Granulosicoccaceae bacterium]
MKKFDSINVIPFIDIMLVLLAIVLTTATFVTNGQLDIDLPSSSAATAANNTERVEIAVDRDGVLFIDGIEKSLEAAELLLLVLPTDTAILLLMDESVEFKQFVAVIDILKRLSLDKVSVLTRTDS